MSGFLELIKFCFQDATHGMITVGVVWVLLEGVKNIVEAARK